MKMKSLLAILVSILIFTSCDKYKDYRNATVLDTGDITYQGCGYLLQMDDDSELLKPVHLPAAMQHANLRVRVKYNHTGMKDTCDYGTKLYDVVTINGIVKINN